MRALVSTSAFAATLAVSAAALAADPKSYTTALDQLPTDYAVIVTVNGKVMRGLPSYSQAVTNLLSLDKGAKKGVEEIKSLCKIDVTTAIDDLTVGLQDGGKKAAFFINGSGLDEKKVTGCLQAFAKKEGQTLTMTASTLGSAKIAEYAIAGKTKKLYVAFVNDCVVITDDPNKKDVLEKALSGKGALAKSRAVQTWQGKISTSALAFGLVVKEIADPNMTVKGGAASVDVSGGDLKIKGSAELKDAKMAASASGELTKELAKAPREFSKSAKSFKVTTQGATISVEGTVYESEYKVLKP